MAEDPHDQVHKYRQHDAEVNGHVDDPDQIDPDDAWAEAVSPEEYVLSSDEAMASALMQTEYGDG